MATNKALTKSEARAWDRLVRRGNGDPIAGATLGMAESDHFQVVAFENHLAAAMVRVLEGHSYVVIDNSTALCLRPGYRRR